VRARPLALGELVARALVGAWRAPPTPPPLSADELATVAPQLVRKGCAGLVAWRIPEAERQGAAAIPLVMARRQAAIAAAALEERLIAALGALKEHGFAPVLLKGWSAARAYPAPGLRPFVDHDLWLERGAAKDLRTLGLPLGEWGVDPHPTIADLDDRPVGALLERTVRVELLGQEVRILGPEDRLRLGALHLARHGASRPVWLCDLALELESERIDWPYLRSGAMFRTRWTEQILALAVRLLGAQAPQVELPPPSPAIERAVLVEWGRAPRELSRLSDLLSTPGRLPVALWSRWPNPIAARLALRGGIDDGPDLLYQLAAVGRRALMLGWRR
jgi:hypothetical protein